MMQTARTSLVVALVIALFAPGVARAQGADPQFLEAKRLFDALDYENAVRALDQSITLLQARSPNEPGRRDELASAYEMRARSKFGLGDQAGSEADFVALLRTDPAYMLTGDVSPRVVALFEAVMSRTVTTLNLSITPATATIDLDGVPITAGGSVPIAVGDHVVKASRPGYRQAQATVTATPGMASELTMVLERVASIVNISTVPANVEVVIDGVNRGKTAASNVSAESAAMVIGDLQPGSHLVELTRDCYVKAEKRLTIDHPDDFTVGPVELQHAVASLTVRGSDPGAQVFIDGQPRGALPFAQPELCEGQHTVEIRSPAGRYVKRVQARAGDSIAVEGTTKPAFALVSTMGQPAGSPDLRLLVERALEASMGATLFAPPADQAAQALRANQLPDGWLAFDANGRPVGTAADVVQPLRRDASTKLSATFASQGVGSVTVVNRNRVVLSLLAAGSGEPDVIEVSLDDQASIAAAVGRLDSRAAVLAALGRRGDHRRGGYTGRRGPERRCEGHGCRNPSRRCRRPGQRPADCG